MTRKVGFSYSFLGSAGLCQRVLHQSGCGHHSVACLRAVGSALPALSQMLCSVLHRPRGARLVLPSAPCHMRSAPDTQAFTGGRTQCPQQHGLLPTGTPAPRLDRRPRPSLAGASHPQPAAACSALGNCFCMCPGSGCDQQEEGCSVKHGRGLSSMSHLGRTSVRHLDSFPDAHVEGHWQILVWGSALKKRPADTELWGPPAFLQGAPGTSPEHTQARSQPPRSPRAFS